MSNGEKFFHFPAAPETHIRVKEAAAREHMSMAGWLHAVVEDALDEEEEIIDLIVLIETKLDRILTLLEEGEWTP